jgi:hypothetical protein
MEPCIPDNLNRMSTSSPAAMMASGVERVMRIASMTVGLVIAVSLKVSSHPINSPSPAIPHF